jgi:hypothetical protein
MHCWYVLCVRENVHWVQSYAASTAPPRACMQGLQYVVDSAVFYKGHLMAQCGNVSITPKSRQVCQDCLQGSQPLAKCRLLSRSLDHPCCYCSTRGPCSTCSNSRDKGVCPHIADKLIKDKFFLIQKRWHKHLAEKGSSTCLV